MNREEMKERDESRVESPSMAPAEAGTLIVRRAQKEDVAPIVAIERQSFTTPWSYDSLYTDIVQNDKALYLVAEAGGQIAGYAGVWKILDEGHITNVAVAPLWRRRHVGQALMAALLDVCRQNGVARVTLEVRAGNGPALGLYEGLGFQAAGLRKGYYEDTGEDAIIMWKEVEEER